MTSVEVAKLVAVMVAAFPASKVNADTSAIYERMLADLDYSTANAAVERLLATSRFLPTVAEIREIALTLHVGDVRGGGEGWGEFLETVKRYGTYRTPGIDFTFADPVVARVVEALGWRNLCLSEQQTADRARFVELYDRLAVTNRRAQLSDGLPAMQRFRALEAKKLEDAKGDGPQPLGKLLALVNGGDRE